MKPEKKQTENSRERKIYRVTLVGSAVNLLLVIFKFAAGILGHSAAMIADAVHSLSDFATDIVVLAFVRVSGKPRDDDHDYGHGKYETLATAIIGIVLLLVGVGIFYNGCLSIVHFLQGEPLKRPDRLALIAALISIVVKEALYRYTVAEGRKLDSQAVMANAWHHRSDALSSIGAAVGIGGAVLLGERWAILDPLAAILVSYFIVRVAIKLSLPSIGELLEKSLPEETEKEIESIVLGFDGVSDLHNLRTRKIGNYFAIEMHIRMDGNLSLEHTHHTTTEIEHALKNRFGAQTFVNIHVEPLKGICCKQA